MRNLRKTAISFSLIFLHLMSVAPGSVLESVQAKRSQLGQKLEAGDVHETARKKAAGVLESPYEQRRENIFALFAESFLNKPADLESFYSIFLPRFVLEIQELQKDSSEYLSQKEKSECQVFSNEDQNISLESKKFELAVNALKKHLPHFSRKLSSRMRVKAMTAKSFFEFAESDLKALGKGLSVESIFDYLEYVLINLQRFGVCISHSQNHALIVKEFEKLAPALMIRGLVGSWDNFQHTDLMLQNFGEDEEEEFDIFVFKYEPQEIVFILELLRLGFDGFRGGSLFTEKSTFRELNQVKQVYLNAVEVKKKGGDLSLILNFFEELSLDYINSDILFSDYDVTLENDITSKLKNFDKKVWNLELIALLKKVLEIAMEEESHFIFDRLFMLSGTIRAAIYVEEAKKQEGKNTLETIYPIVIQKMKEWQRRVHSERLHIKLKSVIEESGVSLETIAKKSRVSTGLIQKILNGDGVEIVTSLSFEKLHETLDEISEQPSVSFLQFKLNLRIKEAIEVHGFDLKEIANTAKLELQRLKAIYESNELEGQEEFEKVSTALNEMLDKPTPEFYRAYIKRIMKQFGFTEKELVSQVSLDPETFRGFLEGEQSLDAGIREKLIWPLSQLLDRPSPVFLVSLLIQKLEFFTAYHGFSLNIIIRKAEPRDFYKYAKRFFDLYLNEESFSELSPQERLIYCSKAIDSILIDIGEADVSVTEIIHSIDSFLEELLELPTPLFRKENEVRRSNIESAFSPAIFQKLGYSGSYLEKVSGVSQSKINKIIRRGFFHPGKEDEERAQLWEAYLYLSELESPAAIKNRYQEKLKKLEAFGYSDLYIYSISAVSTFTLSKLKKGNLVPLIDPETKCRLEITFRFLENNSSPSEFYDRLKRRVKEAHENRGFSFVQIRTAAGLSHTVFSRLTKSLNSEEGEMLSLKSQKQLEFALEYLGSRVSPFEKKVRFLEKLKWAVSKRISQSEIARVSNLSVKAISAFLNGRDTALSISSLYDVSLAIDYLLGEREDLEYLQMRSREINELIKRAIMSGFSLQSIAAYANLDFQLVSNSFNGYLDLSHQELFRLSLVLNWLIGGSRVQGNTNAKVLENALPPDVFGKVKLTMRTLSVGLRELYFKSA